MLEKEIAEIEALARSVEVLIDKGEYSKAERKMSALKRSVYATEADREWARLKATIWLRKGRPEEAFSVIREHLYEMWGSPDGLLLATRVNPPVSPESKHYYLEITGCSVHFGFTVFGPDYVTSFQAVAKSAEEAIGYFLALARVRGKEDLRLVSKELFTGIPPAVGHEGILRTHPFRRAKKSELKLARPIMQ